MSKELKVRYYRPREEFRLDITDMENFVFDMSKCIKCKGCTWVEHTYMPGVKYTTRCPSATRFVFDSYGAYGKMRIGHAMAEGMLGWNEKALEIMYACTLCGACDVGCKRNLDLEIGLTLEALRVKAVKDGAGPMPEHRKMAEKIIRSHNCYGASHEKRMGWITKQITPAKKADILYYAGCNASYVNKEIARATVKIFRACDDKYMLMPDEWCCGNKIFSVGMFDEAKAIAERNIAEVRKTGAKIMVVSCAEGYRMWKVDYPKLLNIATDDLGFRVMHLMEYANEKIKDGSLKLKKNMDLRVAYHDSCSVSRLCDPWTPYEGKRGWMGCVEPRLKRRRGTTGLYREPREILKSIPGVEFVEMPRTRENSFCCGAGRGTQEAFPEFSSWSANQRLEEVKDVGAETLVSACPWCKDNFTGALNAQGENIPVLDISEIIFAAIEGQEV